MNAGEPGLKPRDDRENDYRREVVGDNFDALIAEALARKVVNPDDFVAECVTNGSINIDQQEDLRVALMARIKKIFNLPFGEDSSISVRILYIDIDNTAYLTSQLKDRMRSQLLQLFNQVFAEQNFDDVFDEKYEETYKRFRSTTFNPLLFVQWLASALKVRLTKDQEKIFVNRLVVLAGDKSNVNHTAISVLKSLKAQFNDANFFCCLTNGAVDWQPAKISALSSELGLTTRVLDSIITNDKTSGEVVRKLTPNSAIIDDDLSNLIGIAERLLEENKDDKNILNRFTLFWFNPNNKEVTEAERVRLARCQTTIIEIHNFAEIITYLQKEN